MNVCAIFKNEALYLKEWVEFHLLAGVSRFFLYNNNSTDDWESVLKPYMETGTVDLTDWPFPNPSQTAAYQHYLNRMANTVGWTAFIDIDEFLFSPSFETIGEAVSLVTETFNCDAIGVNWVCFGSGGQEEYEPKPVIERFTWRPFTTAPVDLHIKSIVRTGNGTRVGSTPHHFEAYTINEYGIPFGGPFSPNHSSDVLRINHYSSKSRAEWEKRIQNGKPDRPNIERNMTWWEQVQPMEVEDFEIQKWLPRLKERLCRD